MHQILKSKLIEKLNYNIQQMTFHIDIERETFYDAVFKYDAVSDSVHNAVSTC